jgi:hypothetical protein
MSVPTAQAFRDAFITSFCEARGYFTDERWHTFCTGSDGSANFTSLMLRVKEQWRLPQEIRVSVLADVASRLGLHFASGSPLTVDAVFVEQSISHSWFPMTVAIEHENVATNFVDEVVKLLSVRAEAKAWLVNLLYEMPHSVIQYLVWGFGFGVGLTFPVTCLCRNTSGTWKTRVLRTIVVYPAPTARQHYLSENP